MLRAPELPAPPSLDELLAEGPVALFLDFDGTLVDIADTPDAIHVPEGLAASLETLSARLDGRLAIVTGRSLDDLETHIGRPAIAMAGSHGVHCLDAERGELCAPPDDLPPEAVQALGDFAEANGIDLERKSHGAALHFRADPAREEEVSAFARRLAQRHDLDVKTGKCVVELMHRGADKASAVEAYLGDALFSGATPVFIGDDVTDEDGFGAAQGYGGFGILAGDPRESCARYHLPTVPRVHRWLGLECSE